MKNKTVLSEEMGIQKEWAEEARKQTLETLPAFLRKLSEDYEHDYGTICHAIACAAIGAAWALERSPGGGITGFQAGCIMWEMIKQWGIFGEGPKRMVCYANMLYPQYEDKFQKTITPDVASYLKIEADKKLRERDGGSERVRAHLEAVASGQVPFGYTVADSD